MRTTMGLVAACAVGLAIWGSVSVASAQSVSVGRGTTYVGNIGTTSVAVTQSPSGTCKKTTIRSSWTGDVTLYASAYNDTIYAFSWTATFCGYTLEPVNTHGYRLTLHGDVADDWLENYVRNVILKGGGHADTIAQWDGSAYGGDGNDDMYGDNQDRLYGDAGDDHFSIINSEVARAVEGGSGTDTLCGNSEDFPLSIELIEIPIGGGC